MGKISIIWETNLRNVLGRKVVAKAILEKITAKNVAKLTKALSKKLKNEYKHHAGQTQN